MSGPRNYHTVCSNTEKDKYDISFKSNFKNYINEFIYKTETDSQTLKTNFQLLKGKRAGLGGGEIRSLGLTYLYYYIQNNQKGPII